MLTRGWRKGLPCGLVNVNPVAARFGQTRIRIGHDGEGRRHGLRQGSVHSRIAANDGRDVGCAQHRHNSVRRGAGVYRGFDGFRHDPIRMSDEIASCRCGARLLADAIDEAQSDAALQFTNPQAHGWLR